ncbi:MAG: pseudouridylate synthase [Ectothiorhodospiraceae bacterium]|nr:pseudouridylate synthase [Ectothiorhodospiraceae bacterium]MCH8502756.1 pseudouridylate synthase [Ectothiorhodospiraceae bacterium]
MDPDLRLPILYQDDHYVAIDKPPGLLVHRTHLSGSDDAAVQRLRNQLRRHVYPVHRLDRPTSGILLFALSPESARPLADAFEQRQVGKRYIAVCRGWPPEEGRIDYPLREHKDAEAQTAVTSYRRLATVELPIPVSRYPAARYSLLDVYPKTGRRHQIRKHMAHIRHPLIGDTTHGEGRHNRLFREHFRFAWLLLRADRLEFRHPFHDEPTSIEAPLPERLHRLFLQLGWDSSHHGRTIGRVTP